VSRYRKVDPRIWNDKKFCALSDNAKLVFFMLLTHPGMTALGAMRATVPGLASELGWEPEAFGEAFGEALSKGMAEHDRKACLVALPRFLRYNPPESPNVVKAWIGAVDLLPECDLKSVVIQRAKGFAEGMTEGYAKAFRETFGKAMPYQEQEQEQEQEQNKSAPPAAAFDFKAELFARWKSVPGSGGGAFLNKLFLDHKPEQRVVEAVEQTLSDTRADPKAFVLGVLRATPGALDDDVDSALAIVRAQDFSGYL
jgi:hypothetical protein